MKKSQSEQGSLHGGLASFDAKCEAEPHFFDRVLREALEHGRIWGEFERLSDFWGYDAESWKLIVEARPEIRYAWLKGCFEGEKEILKNLHEMSTRNHMDRLDLIRTKLLIFLLEKRLKRSVQEAGELGGLEQDGFDGIERDVMVLLRKKKSG